MAVYTTLYTGVVNYVPPAPEDDYGPTKPCVTPEVALCLAEIAAQVEDAVLEINRLDPLLAHKDSGPIDLLVHARHQLLALAAPWVQADRQVVQLHQPQVPPALLARLDALLEAKWRANG